MTGPWPPGLAEMVELVNQFRRLPSRGRLVLRCGAAVPAALAEDGSGGPEYVPQPGLAAGEMLTYGQVALEVNGAMGPGAWQLLEDGEVLTSGAIAVPSLPGGQ